MTFSNGKKFVHEELLKMNRGFQNRLSKILEATVEIEVVAADQIIWTSRIAKNEGVKLEQKGANRVIECSGSA